MGARQHPQLSKDLGSTTEFPTEQIRSRYEYADTPSESSALMITRPLEFDPSCSSMHSSISLCHMDTQLERVSQATPEGWKGTPMIPIVELIRSICETHIRVVNDRT